MQTRANFTLPRVVASLVGKQKQYVCEACGESFDSEKDLRSHVFDVGLVE
jgi:uncharacterized Zn-finger protein